MWKFCSLSALELSPPVVADLTGRHAPSRTPRAHPTRLFNKEPLLQFLLNRESVPAAQLSLVGHIRGLKACAVRQWRLTCGRT